MKSRRVGTLTFGILMIVLGILYLCITVFNLPIEKYVINLWPLILISLGIETLVLDRLSLKNNVELKYDFISFVLIIIMAAFCFGTYAVAKFWDHYL
jgi:hypothetical protein